MRRHSVDRLFLLATILLVIVGFFIFSSAAMGLATRQAISYTTVIAKQFIVGFLVGGALLFILATINYKRWRHWALWLFGIAVLMCLAVFLPKIGFSYNGARRWIGIGQFSFQPSELLKFASVLYFAGWIATVKKNIGTFRYGALPLIVILAIIGVVLIKEPDTGTCAVLAASLLAMFISAGGRWRHVGLIILISLIVLASLVFLRPYLMQRILTFLHPSQNSLTAGYQIQQSLIAVGSGRVFGRGFGQSIQKFSFLPEPVGDSIFAVAAEEFGFVGSLVLIGLIIFFALRGYRIAVRANDSFASSLTVGFVTLIVLQSFVNIGAMLAVLPLTGIPLIFVSEGGTAMLFALAEVGIILNVSKNQKG
jgi:cell division protein FtsW